MQSLQKQLEELPHLATALHVALAVTPKTALQSKVNSTPEPSCPIDVRVEELIGQIEDAIDRCDGMRIGDLINQPATKFYIWRGETRTEQHLAGWERAIAIRRVHVRANAILGFDKLKQRRVAPCPGCDLPTLYSYVGDDEVLCSDEECGLAMKLAEYEAYCVALAASQ